MLWLFAQERKQRMDETLALSTAYRGTALLLGDVVEADHHYTGAHCRDVVDLSLEVADAFGLDSGQKRNNRVRGASTRRREDPHPQGDHQQARPAERRRVDADAPAHDRRRADAQAGGGLLADVGTIVRASHERWDGGGYPDGLAGQEIPIEARIVSTCDAFSAMTTDRSYRRAMPTEQAIAELRSCAGSHFDPAVVAELERSFGVSAPAPANRKLQPWQVMGLPKVAA